MQLILLTPPNREKHEIDTIINCLNLGFRCHIRKSIIDLEYVKSLLHHIDPCHQHNIGIHGTVFFDTGLDICHYHLKSHEMYRDHFKKEGLTVSKSFHSIDDINSWDQVNCPLSYGFLSPIYDSISKKEYRAAFSKDALERFLRKKHPFPIYALGGVEQSRIEALKRMGFDGAVVLGAIWEKEYKKRYYIAEKLMRLA